MPPVDPIEVIGDRADKHAKRRLDLADVVGQVEAKWACEVAAAGRHHIFSVARLGSVVAEIARLGRTLLAWRDQLLAYFSTGRASNGGTEAINGIIELHRRIARGFRNPCNYRLRMILAAGRLTHPNLR